ncbi:MAG: LptA/OstA family protein [Verrucomicrobiota bacterium]
MKKRLIVSAFWIMACSTPVWAQEKSAEPSSRVTQIKSDKMTFNYDEHYAFFERNVVVTDPQIKIKCDQMTVKTDDKNRIAQVIAIGNVFIEQGDKIALSGHALYDVKEGKIVLTKNPSVRQGEDVLRGRKITFYRDSNRIISEGGASSSFQPGKGGRKPFK